MKTYISREICDLLGMSERTFRRYEKDGIVTAKLGVFNEDDLKRLSCVDLLKSAGYRTADTLVTKLNSMSMEEVQALIDESNELDEARDHETPGAKGHSLTESAPDTPAPVAVAPTSGASDMTVWLHYELRPGLRLLVEQGADGDTRSAATQIRLKYGR